MTETAVAPADPSKVNGEPSNKDDLATILAQAVTENSLARLTKEQRMAYYLRVCNSLNLNPLTRPFEWLVSKSKTGDKLSLYARKECTEQLRRRDNVSAEIVAREMLPNELYAVTCRATIPAGPGRDARHDESIGAVSLKGLAGEARANAVMAAETKAKRRVTLSICGMGFLDETEVENIPGAEALVESKPETKPTTPPSPAPTQAYETKTESPAPQSTQTPENGSSIITESQLQRVAKLRSTLFDTMPDKSKDEKDGLWKGILAKRKVTTAKALTTAQAAELISNLRTQLDIKEMQEGLRDFEKRGF